MNSSKKIALVTGAGTGIGRAVAAALHTADYAVVLAGRRLQVLEEARMQIGMSPDDSLVVAADVGSEADVRALFQQIRDRFGRLDVLFNNAGINVPPKSVGELELQEWQAVVDVNLTGVFLCTREAFRLMKSQQPRGGRIINNGSISAVTPRPLAAAYTSTKHGVTGLTKATSLDGREFDIGCGQINIGNADTDMVTHTKTGALQANGQTAVEPTMDVDDVANAVLYMAGLPLNANVLSLTVMANKMPFVGRG